MNQLINNNDFFSTQKIKTTKKQEKEFGTFKIKKLKKIKIEHESLPWITDPQLPSVAIPNI